VDNLLKSYDYHLPLELIATRHVEPRDHSRLLVYNQNDDSITHSHIYDLPNFLPQDSAIVFNESKVFACRLLCKKESQGQGAAEIFFLSIRPDEKGRYKVLIKCRGTKKIGDRFLLPDNKSATICELLGDSFYITTDIEESRLPLYLETNAKIPIPPYIRDGESDSVDKIQYQTIYASDQEVGSVAAPTAGLHFTPELLTRLSSNKITVAKVALHVGMGTFLPVKTDLITDHKMHAERFSISSENYDLIRKAQYVTAVGTTSLRTLESIAKMENFTPERTYDTEIFLYPGVPARSINALLTNFHLPKSSLLMLVSSLIGRERCLELYDVAIKERYRFFSYGDAMLILRKNQNEKSEG